MARQTKEERAAKVKAYRIAHREKIAAQKKVYSDAHREEIAAKDKVYADAHREERNEKGRAYNEAHREERNAYARARYAARYEEIVTRNRAYRKTHREELNTKRAVYHAAHPEQHRKHCVTRRARKQGAGGTYTTGQWRALCDWFGSACLRCGATGILSVDHVVPVSKGGTNDIGNLQPLCKPCNSTKHDYATDYRDPAKLAAFLETMKEA